VYINYKSQFKDGGAAAAPKGRQAAAGTAARQTKAKGKRGAAAAGLTGFMSAAWLDQQEEINSGRRSKGRKRRSRKGKGAAGGSGGGGSGGGKRKRGSSGGRWSTVGGRKVGLAGALSCACGRTGLSAHLRSPAECILMRSCCQKHRCAASQTSSVCTPVQPC
jgi:hypothetical protein